MSAPHNNDEQEGRFSYDGLDRVMHEKARLGILTSLVSNPDGLLFGELKELCSLTDGNLSRHLQALEDAGLVEIWKSFRQRRPQTLVRISADGKKRFLDYLEELERVLKDAQTAKKATEKKAGKRLGEEWSPA